MTLTKMCILCLRNSLSRKIRGVFRGVQDMTAYRTCSHKLESEVVARD